MNLVLASQSPRRKQLLENAGYAFAVRAPEDSVEAGVCCTGGPGAMVVEASYLKARHIARQLADSQTEQTVVLAADTVAVCHGQVLGKPRNRDDAQRMLALMSGQRHSVLTGITLWHVASGRFVSHLEETVLRMDDLAEPQLEAFLDSGDWEGKAGAFGYQDGLDWVHIEDGLASNVVGLPVERLPGLFEKLEESVASVGE